MTKKKVSGLRKLAMLILTFAVANIVAHAQTFTVCYTFNPNTDPLGFDSPGTMAQGQDGNIYSTALQGVGSQGAGAVFSMTPACVLSVVYQFAVGSGGQTPYSGVTLGTDGNLYGTVGPDFFEGNYNGLGSIFSTTTAGNLTYLYTFPLTGNVGYPVYSTPVEGPDGNFYGGTASVNVAGVNVIGAIYKVTPAGDLTVLYQTTDFGNFGTLTPGTDGNFYGIDSVLGSIFKITPSGQYTPLYSFNSDAQPTGLIQGIDGNFYGDTFAGGHGCGIVFKMTPKGKVTVLYAFDPANFDGCLNYSGLVQATDGNLYGVNQSGGTFGWGTIFRISPKGTGYSNLYNFDGLTSGLSQITLLQHTNGTLYGLSNLGGGVPCQTYCGSFYSLNMGLKPFVSLVPTSGAVGSTIGILGQGFTGAKKVTFTGGSAAFTVVSDTYLTATVPSSAKLGFVTVKTTTGTLKSNKKFRVTP